jgi:hypothetical protein
MMLSTGEIHDILMKGWNLHAHSRKLQNLGRQAFINML